jgi:hypothetical protein
MVLPPKEGAASDILPKTVAEFKDIVMRRWCLIPLA